MEITFTLAGKKHQVSGDDIRAKLQAVKALGLEGTSWTIEGTSEELEKLLGASPRSVRRAGATGVTRAPKGKRRSDLTSEEQSQLVAKAKRAKKQGTSLKDLLRAEGIDGRGGTVKWLESAASN